MVARLADQLIKRRAQIWRLPAREHLLHTAAVALKQLQRYEQLAPRSIERQCRDHLHHALRKPGVAREVLDLGGLLSRDRGAEREQRSGGVVDVALQRRHGRHRIVVEIELMLVDEPRQPFDRQAAAPDCMPEFGRDRIALDTAMTLAGEHVRPPLQADFAGQRLAHLIADAGNLDVEGINRKQRAALAGGHEQGGRIARKIVAPHQLGAELGRLPAFVRGAHGTAISAAATRLRSPIMML